MKILFYILFYLYLRESGAYLQEFAKVVYTNPKYVENTKAFTWRANRREAYKSNITTTLLHPWGNNVTFQFTYSISGIGTEFKWTKEVCNVIKFKWVIEMFEESSIKVTCPMPAKLYSLYILEFPPKYFPLPLPKGDTNVLLSFYLTSTMERLLELSVHLKTQ